MGALIRRLTPLGLAALLAACSSANPPHQSKTDGWPDRSPRAEREAVAHGGEPSHYKIGRPYSIAGVRYFPRERFEHLETGRASWYGPGFHGRRTANGERYDSQALTAAHPTLQLPSIIRVTNVGNGRSTVLRVNDRGPYHGDRVLDVSEAAAEELGFKRLGTALVRVEVLDAPSREVARLAQSGAPVRQLDEVRDRAADAPGRPLPAEPPQPEVQLASIGARVGGAPAAAPAPTDAAYVQVGAFADADNAWRLQQRLRGLGVVEVVPTAVEGRPIYRVRLGPYPNLDLAEAALGELGAHGVNGAQLVVVR